MTADFSAQRGNMVEGQLRTSDITDVAVLDAMAAIPREAFVPERRRALAYMDEDLQIVPPSSTSAARYLMEPAQFGKLLQLATIGRDDFVLVIGCATGYSAAVLSRIASSVIALESDAALAESASATLAEHGYDNATVVQGPLPEGYPSEGPYDVIVIEGAVDSVPETLLTQLRDGGRLVTVRGRGNSAFAELFVKDGEIISSRRASNSAVQPLPGFEAVPAFVF